MAKEKLQTTAAIGALIRRTRKQQGVSQKEKASISTPSSVFIKTWPGYYSATLPYYYDRRT